MVRRVGGILAVGIGTLFACQSIAGFDDKELDPKYSADARLDAAADVTIADAVWESAAPASGWDPRPPGRPAGAAVASGTGTRRFFAAKHVYFGTVDPTTGSEDADAWKRIGHTIDNEVTTAAILQSKSSQVCDKRPSGSADLLVDGDDGRDNVAGHLFSYGASTLSFKFELDINKDMEAGKRPTYLLMLEDLDPGRDDPFVPGAIFITVKRDLTVEPLPKWDGSDQFWVDANTVLPTDGGILDAGTADASAVEAGEAGQAFDLVPRFHFPAGYVKDNVWVSGDFGSSPMTLPLYAFDPVNLIDAETVSLVAELTPTHDKVVRSTMSAVISATNVTNQFKPVAAKLVDCNPALTTVLLGFLGNSMDLAIAPPAFSQPSTECGAASMGFSFAWEPVVAPAGAKVVTPDPPCAL